MKNQLLPYREVISVDTKTSLSKFFTDLNFVFWENHTELSNPYATTNLTFWFH
jgi:hypothetical protein